MLSTPKRSRRAALSACVIETLEARKLFTGTWTALTHAAPAIIDYAFLLPDGRVMAQISQDSTSWAILTPSSTGSYSAGTWTTVAASHDTRLYHSTTVLQNGDVFVAGGEYGAGGATAEIYAPSTNTWTELPAIPSGDKILDAESMLLPNGNVLVGAVASGGSIEYNPTTNTWSSQSILSGRDLDEKTWVRLPDGSIITPDGYQSGDLTSERFIPSQNKWIADASMPVNLIDGEGEMGPGLLLPDGRAFFIGATGNTAYYTPSGSTAPGTWTAGPVLPNGLGDDDAPAAELPDGTLLLDLGPTDSYNGPSSYYTFDPQTNIYTAVSGAPYTSKQPYLNAFLDLPNGQVLWTDQVESTAYVYTPNVTPVASGVPVINSITANSNGSFQLTGTGLNGLDQGASYGDDNQMDSNYPIIRLTTTTGSSVYYADDFNWSAVGVQTGSTTETVNFNAPSGLVTNGGVYDLYAVANGINSNDVTVYTSTAANNAASLGIAPAPATVTAGSTVQLTGTAYDSTGAVTTVDPGLHWSVVSGGGSINSSTGLYTAPSTGGLVTVALSCGDLVQTVQIGVVNSPWVSQDIGSPGVTGIAYDSSGVTTLQGSGTDISGTSDQFRYDYQTMTGDGSIVAEVTQSNSIAYAKAGLMMRNTLDANSAMAFASEDYAHYSHFIRRTTLGGTTSDAELVQGGDPYWVKLVRSGNNFSDYASPDGVTWTQVGTTQSITMNATIYVGLADTAYNNSSLSTAVFSNVNVSNPTIATAASVAPSPATGTSAALSVLGANIPNAAGQSSLTYTWAASSKPTGSTVSFTGPTNGTNSARNITATFNQAGNYQFTVTASDGTSNVSSSVNVTVTQTLTTISVTPATPSISDGQTQQFSDLGYDQFGNPMSPQPTLNWTVDNGSVGSISSTGLYTAPASGPGTATVRAAGGSVSGTAAVTVILSVINGSGGNDTIRLLRSGTNLQVYLNNPTTPAYTVTYGTLGSLTVNANGGNDNINVDFSGGATPVPAGGLSVNGGTGGTDTLIVTGTTGNDSASVNTSNITFNSSPISYTNIESIIINGNGGTDSLAQTAQPGNAATLTFNGNTSGGPTSTDTLNISGGTFAFPQPTAGAGIQPLNLSSLVIGPNSLVSLGTTSTSDRYVVVLGSLTFTGLSGQLDLGGNDLIDQTDSLFSMNTAVASAYAGGAWNGSGIASTAARSDTTHLTTLGVMQAGLTGVFDQQPVSSSYILVKYTYAGDATLDGKVDGSDYSRIDNALLTNGTGWNNGDFNYDGVVNGSDYTLIDNAFNTQGASLTAMIAQSIPSHTASPAAATPTNSYALSVPGPASLADSESESRKHRRLIGEIGPSTVEPRS